MLVVNLARHTKCGAVLGLVTRRSECHFFSIGVTYWTERTNIAPGVVPAPDCIQPVLVAALASNLLGELSVLLIDLEQLLLHLAEVALHLDYLLLEFDEPPGHLGVLALVG